MDAVQVGSGRLPTGRVTPAVWPAPTARAVPARAVEAERAAPVTGGEAREGWGSGR